MSKSEEYLNSDLPYEELDKDDRHFIVMQACGWYVGEDNWLHRDDLKMKMVGRNDYSDDWKYCAPLLSWFYIDTEQRTFSVYAKIKIEDRFVEVEVPIFPGKMDRDQVTRSTIVFAVCEKMRFERKWDNEKIVSKETCGNRSVPNDEGAQVG